MDVNAFSTTIYHMAHALKQEIPGLSIVRFPRIFLHYRLVRKVIRTFPAIDITNNLLFLRFCSWIFAYRYRNRRTVVINIVDSPLAIYLRKALPVINVSDATHALLEESYYGTYDFISKSRSEFYHRAERAAIHSLHASYSSAWAMESAIRDYAGRPEDLSVISWGCNLPQRPSSDARLTADDTRCRLLFVAAQWQRKGGDVVLEVAKLLRDRNIPVSIDLVGVEAAAAYPNGVEVVHHGRLRKDEPSALAKLFELYREATFLILPTKQDCTPMVFAEANMFGTPAITSDVGGVSSVVRDGENGLALPSGATAEIYADEIAKFWLDRSRYEALRRSSRLTYEKRLNWTIWARGILQLVRNLEKDGRV